MFPHAFAILLIAIAAGACQRSDESTRTKFMESRSVFGKKEVSRDQGLDARADAKRPREIDSEIAKRPREIDSEIVLGQEPIDPKGDGNPQDDQNTGGDTGDVEVGSDTGGDTGDVEVGNDTGGDTGDVEVGNDTGGDTGDVEVGNDTGGDTGDGGEEEGGDQPDEEEGQPDPDPVEPKPQVVDMTIPLIRLCSTGLEEAKSGTLPAGKTPFLKSIDVPLTLKLVALDGNDNPANSYDIDLSSSMERLKADARTNARIRFSTEVAIADGHYDAHLCLQGSSEQCVTTKEQFPALGIAHLWYWNLRAGANIGYIHRLRVENGELVNRFNPSYERPGGAPWYDRSRPTYPQYFEMGFGVLYDKNPAAINSSETPVGECSLVYSPLLVNFDDAGILLTSQRDGVLFDIDADGNPEQISWPSSERTMFLVLDKDGDGKITSANEMFGNYTRNPKGGTDPNGFDSLAHYDANGDGVIDAEDPIFSALRFWSDRSLLGHTDKGELLTLKELGVASISLDYQAMSEVDRYGNETRQRSTLMMADGRYRLIFDVWFSL